jgi:hypothetical protein
VVAAAASVVVILVTGTVTEMAIQYQEEVTTIQLPGMLIVMHQPAAIRQIPSILQVATTPQVAAILPILPRAAILPVAAILLAAAAGAQPFRPPVRLEAAPANIPGYSFVVNVLNIK